MRRLLVLILLLSMGSAAMARQAVVEGVRTWSGPDHTRIVFDLSRPVQHRLFTLKHPNRVVVDIDAAQLKSGVVPAVDDAGVLQDIRSAPRNGNDLRVVFDLDRAVRPKSFLVKPNDTYGDRLVVDLEKPAESRSPVKTVPRSRRQLVIAVDAGHGGEDPGAIGPHGTYEKDVTLGVARKVASLIDRQPGMKAVLIRQGDYYVGLRDRTRKARKAHADIFVSIHADSIRDRSVKGSSVYILSRRGASSEMARMLAKQENSADRIGGVSLEDKDDLVASVLLDLSRAATIESSTSLAKSVLGELDGVGPVHKHRVEKAGFVVLKSLDMPSVLVELAFISNPREERKLRDDGHQWKLARAIEDGVTGYAKNHMPGLRMASSEHYVVKRGDTLSEIARRYGVSVDRLQSINDLNGDTIVAGSRLLIP
jgi:N-acetylmuramoyl-L-alanine amidase